jgi:membrane protein YqaA with SNARE-associated domain
MRKKKKFNAVVYSTVRIVGNGSGSVGSVCLGHPGSVS